MSVKNEKEVIRNLGEQPLSKIMVDNDIKPHDLVAASSEIITHKMVSRATKGRRLTPKIKKKILNSLNAATGKFYAMNEIFNY